MTSPCFTCTPSHLTARFSFLLLVYNQETRNNRPGENDTSFISKFGVGIKQAGFFLGDRIRCLTKMKHLTQTHVFQLSKEEFKKRARSQLNVYEAAIKRREPGGSQYTPDDEKYLGFLMDEIKQHELSHESFTIFILKLNQPIAKKILEDNKYRKLPMELAEIYHFHLHPEHKSEQIHVLKQKADDQASHFAVLAVVSKRRQISSSSSSSSGTSTPLAPLLCSSSVYVDGRKDEHEEVEDFRDLQDPVAVSIEKGRGLFGFSMEIPDPDTSDPRSYAPTTGTGRKSQPDAFEKKKIPIQGRCFFDFLFVSSVSFLLLPRFSFLLSLSLLNLSPPLSPGFIIYYPYDNGCESRPIRSYDSSSTTAANDACSSSSSLTPRSALPPASSSETDYNLGRAFFSVYWQDRLVPQALLEKLHFFPRITGKFSEENQKISKKYPGRIRGFLFFDR